MSKRIFRSVFLVAGVVLLACLGLILGISYEYFTKVQEEQLRSQTALAARAVEHEGMAFFEGLAEGAYRITWVAGDGTVLYDTTAPAQTLENHIAREEIQQALETGVGESARFSSTMAEKTLNRAQRLKDGTVLRVSATQYTVLALSLGMLQPLVLVLLGAVALSALLARRLSKKMVEPINALNLDAPLENETYEELSPLLSRLEHQRRQIKEQMEELSRRQTEFSAVTDSMGEGLISLNGEGIILSINPAAARLFGRDETSVGKDMLTVDRSLAMQELVAGALAGRHIEKTMPLGGGDYQLDASPVCSGDQVTGAVLLAFDVTQRARAEQMRREFSANVSHELKTPLHTIMGSGELIENGLVKPEDLPAFGGRIRAEAKRLVTLIEDIIRLSQLDEGMELAREKTDLLSIAREAAEAVAPQAEAKGVTVAVEGAETPIEGVRRLLYEIAYNLVDNAVKYNVEGGKVKISVSPEGGRAMLRVADTGIGIPGEHQSRVFERFYRVDKSHSRQTGGTGLGLSIVKHAVQYHHGELKLSSTPGRGTTVTAVFPGLIP